MLCGIKIVEGPYAIFVYPTSSTSILRETSIDGTGWSPARRLKVMCSMAAQWNLR